MGTIGITTAYLSNANKKASITTIEGDPNICKLAQIDKKLRLKNIEIIIVLLTKYFLSC